MKTTIVINIILCMLGILVYFINRYANRSRKTRPSLSYWWADNWPEFIATVAMNLALMIIIHLPQTYVSLDRLFTGLPFDIKVSGIPALSFALGLGLTASFYRMFKSKANLK